MQCSTRDYGVAHPWIGGEIVVNSKPVRSGRDVRLKILKVAWILPDSLGETCKGMCRGGEGIGARVCLLSSRSNHERGVGMEVLLFSLLFVIDLFWWIRR